MLHIPALRASWRHSLACAAVAEDLAAASSLDKDSAYTGALLHDIGRLALAVMHPDPYSQLFQGMTGTADVVLQRERELFGVDHCEAGRLLTASWGLPQVFIDITSHHHDQSQPARSDLVGLIGIGCRMADALGFEFVPNPACESYQLLISQLPAAVREHMPVDPNEIASRITDKISCIESMHSSTPANAHPAQWNRSNPPIVANVGQRVSTTSPSAHGRPH